MPSPVRLHIAQVLADLHSLQNTDPRAALDLLNVNKASDQDARGKRHILTTDRSDTSWKYLKSTPKLDRDDSNLSLRSASEGIPQTEGGILAAAHDLAQEDADLRRATELIELHKGRDRLKDFGAAGLARSKERVDAVLANKVQLASA